MYKTSKSFLTFFVFVLFIFLFQQCKSGDNRMSKSDIEYIKQNYSEEAINLLYETAYFQDDGEMLDSLIKWNNDVYIYLNGALWSDDSLYVKNVLKQLNELKLPIRLSLTKDSTHANMFIFFGDSSSLKKRLGSEFDYSIGGRFRVFEHHSFIDSCIIGINNSAEIYSSCLNIADRSKYRQVVLMNEISNSLGIIGDSWLYPGSVFSEGNIESGYLKDFDKEIVRLLYEPCLPFKYPRKQFEEDFSDILYHENAEKKIAEFVKKNNLNPDILTFIQKHGLSNDSVVKFPSHIFVKVSGNYQKEDIDFCKEAIAQYNTVSDNIHLEFIPLDSIYNLPAIDILYDEFTKSKSLKVENSLIKITKNKLGVAYKTRIQSEIKVHFEKSELSKVQKMKNNGIFESIFEALGFNNVEDLSEINSSGQIVLKPKYKEILSLYYNPVIPPELTKAQLGKIIEMVKIGN